MAPAGDALRAWTETMNLHNLARWAMFATAALLFVSALPTAQASLYNDAFNTVCSKIPDALLKEKKKDCESIRDRGCAALEGPEGAHTVLTNELYKKAKEIREKGRALPVHFVTNNLAGVVDDAAKNQSGVKAC